jgi:hypothetical protein
VKPGASMLRAMCAVAVWEPADAETVSRDEPRSAELAAVSVSVVESDAGLALHVAVTPLGRPAMVRVAGLSEWMVMRIEADCPGLRVRVAGLAMSRSEGAGASASMRAWPAGLPHPVTRS